MVYIQAIKKRGFLRQLAERAKKKDGLSLRDVLLNAQGGQFTPTFQGGRLLVSTSGAGQSGSFEISVQGKEWTPDNVFALIEELIEILDLVVSQGLATDTADESSINALFVEMCAADELTTVRSSRSDFTCINWPYYGGSV